MNIKKVPTLQKEKKHRGKSLLFSSRKREEICLLSTILIIFGIDILIPISIPIWMLYLIPLILMPVGISRVGSFTFVFICSLLTYLGFELSAEVEWSALTLANLLFNIFIIWITSWASIEVKRKSLILVSHENNLKNFVENTPAAIAMFDLEMRYLAASRKFRIDYGIEDVDVIGKSHYEIFPDIPDRWKGVHQRCLAGATETSSGDEFPRADGTIDYLKWEVNPWYKEGHSIGGILMYGEIITDQRIAEMAIKESEERFHKFFHAGPVAKNISTLPDGSWIEVNDSFLKLIEFTREEVIGRNSVELGIIDSIEQNKLSALIYEKGCIEGRGLFITTKSGKRKFVLFTAAVITLNGREHAISTLMDVTKEREAQNAAQEANRRLQEADRRKDDFLATLSHELRTPLSCILMWAQMWRQKKVSINEFDEAFASIEKNAIIQNQLISDLLDVSRIISGKIVLDLAESNLNDILLQSITTVLPNANEKELKIATELTPEMTNVLCDPIRIKQIILNLLTNSIKFSNPNSTISVKSKIEIDKVIIQIEDQGKGISAEYLPHIFERFSQEDGSLARKFGGLGLGMSIVKDLVDLHGGSIVVQSPGQDQGTSFKVILPRKTTSTSPIKLNKPTEELKHIKECDLLAVRILVVDDNEDTLSLTRIFFKKLGVKVKTAKSAREGLINFKMYKPDILISDISMPEEDGIEFIKKIRHLTKDEGGETPAIALTGYASREDAKRVLSAGYQAHLPKPAEIKKLQSVILNMLSKDLPSKN